MRDCPFIRPVHRGPGDREKDPADDFINYHERLSLYQACAMCIMGRVTERRILQVTFFTSFMRGCPFSRLVHRGPSDGEKDPAGDFLQEFS
jgi:hypothetical protein